MGATYTVFRREFASYFNTPIGYVFMAFFLLVTKAFFVVSLFTNNVADMRGYFQNMPLFFLFFVPAIAMRLWSEERKLGTLEWLLTLPMNAGQAVMGKYLAGLAFIAVTLVLSLDLPVFLWVYGNPDIGPIIGGYLGVMVLGMVYLAIGAFASSLTSDQIVAFVIGVAICFVFFMISLPDFLEWMKDWFGASVTGKIELFGIYAHFLSISRGVVDSRDVLYAFSVSGIFLFLNYLIVDHRS